MGAAKTFLEIFREVSEKYSSKNALIDMDGKRHITYAQLDEQSSRICGALMDKGVTKGDLVPICMSRCAEYIAAEIGVLKAGAAFAPLSSEYPQARIEHISKDCGAKFVIDDELVQQALTHEPAEGVPVGLDDKAFLIYTSGSSGNPKGIVHTHRSMAASVVRHAKAFDSTDKDIHLCCGPFSFIVMMVDIYTPLSQGQTVHILPEEKRRDIRALGQYIEDHKITTAFISPQMLKLLKTDSSDLRLVVTGSERVSRITGHGYRFMNLYGCSETAGVAVMFEVDASYDNTPIGKAADGIQAFLLCDDGHIGTAGEEGELCIVGDIASGYYKLPEQTEKAFQKLDDGSVCFHTNDICRMLPDGNLVYVDRKDWMVKINGQRVELGETEAAVSALAGVTSAAVKGFVNPHGQTYLCAFYTTDRELTPDDIKNALSASLPEYMIPTHYVKLEKLPVNANGKIDRKSLKAPKEKADQREYVPPESEKEKTLCAAFEKILGVSPVGITDDFFELGGDSIQAMILSVELEGLTIENIYKCKTPQKLADVWNGAVRQERNAADDPKFKDQFDSQGRLRTPVSMRFYRKTQSPRFSLRFDEDIDPSALQYAAEMAIARFKAFGFKIVRDENRYYCAINNNRPVIHHNDGGRKTIGGSGNNGFLTRIGYSGSEVTVDMFHGTNDGVGSLKFLQTLAYYYCSRKYGTTPDGIDGLILADTPEDPREYADSTLFLPDEPAAPRERAQYERAYTVGDGLIEDKGRCAHFHFTVDGENTDRFVRENDTSTAAMFTYFMSKVIADRNALDGVPIVSAMAVDARPSYQAEATMQCCVGTLSIAFEEDMARRPVKQGLAAIRERITAEADPCNITAAAQREYQQMRRLDQDHQKLEEKLAYCSKISEKAVGRYTFGISYVGEIHFGKGIDEHIIDVSTILPAGAIPITVEIVRWADSYLITYMSRLKNDPYAPALCDLLNAEGIPCRLERRQDFEEAVLDLEG